MGFTPTDPWSESFSWLDYDSVNFVEGMGSLNIIFTVLFMYILVTIIVVNIELCRKKKFKFREIAELDNKDGLKTNIPMRPAKISDFNEGRSNKAELL